MTGLLANFMAHCVIINLDHSLDTGEFAMAIVMIHVHGLSVINSIFVCATAPMHVCLLLCFSVS